MANLKELIGKALQEQGQQGSGHITALRQLLGKIEREHGREVIRQLRPSGFRLIFAAVHPDLAKKVGNQHEYACQLNHYKANNGYKYDRTRKEWIDERAK